MAVRVVDIKLVSAVGADLWSVTDLDSKAEDFCMCVGHIVDFKSEMMPSRNAFDISIAPAGLASQIAGDCRVNLDAFDFEPGTGEIEGWTLRKRHAQHVAVKIAGRIEVGHYQRDVIKSFDLQRVG